MGDVRIVKIRGLDSGACPVCGNDDLFWEKTAVHAETLADDGQSWWPQGSSMLEDSETTLQECAQCGHQFLPIFLDPPQESMGEKND